MAEAESFILPSKLSIPGQGSPSHKAKQSHPKFLSGLRYKAIFVVVLVALLPLFPSQAPDFVSQSILTRSWELIHLLFVGIAVSYGLFSRRNADHEADKETPLKADTPQSYVSRILQVSSVFDDDEVVSPSGCPDDSKIQTWSSQYHPGEPLVLVEKGSSNGDSSGNKPLFLPVRSLKLRARRPESIDSCDGCSVSGNGSRLASNTMDEIGRRGSFRGSDALGLKYDLRGSVVLPSPIPWRSRSERMEVKDEMVAGTGITSPPLDANSGPSKPPSFRSSDRRSTSTTPSPKRLSPSSSFSPEMRAKTSEDSLKKKSFYKSSPPPAPPPPPVPLGHMSGYNSDRKDRRKNFNDELKDLSRRVNDSNMGSSGSSGSSITRSVRTVRWKQLQGTMVDAATMSSPDEPLEDLGSATHQPFPPRLPTRSTEKKNELVEKVIVASNDSDSESDSVSESSDVEDAPSSAMEVGPDENEVDKKADEFIAKFREQIRLQRIESIKRSSGHRSVKNPK